MAQLKIWTMWRSDAESTSLKTYGPAGKVWVPTPGTSTGPSNVTVVLLFQSSALARGRIARTARLKQKAIATALDRYNFFIEFTSKLSGGVRFCSVLFESDLQ